MDQSIDHLLASEAGRVFDHAALLGDVSEGAMGEVWSVIDAYSTGSTSLSMVLAVTASASVAYSNPSPPWLAAMVAGVLIGAGTVLAALSVRKAHRLRKAGDMVGFVGMPSGINGSQEEMQRALDVLQAEHDRVRSELAQRAQQIARLEAELRASEIKASRTIGELQARIAAEVAAREAALTGAARPAGSGEIEVKDRPKVRSEPA